ncbi:carbonic anhydrase family protein [Bacillus sp. S13(2024)]|uniref:carbonic anhydrase n=1 Tax=unclassified Bacillus (in: firmicutes) TaxID=185979 RepID=UPI003D25C7FE
MKIKLFSFLIVFSIIISACSNDVLKTTKEKNESKSNMIESGKYQSPINIVSNNVKSMNDIGTLDLNYNNSFVSVKDNGHTIEVKNQDGIANINGRQFSLTQFHFHAPSEHTIDGKQYEMELHFVNKSSSGRLAVLGVFFTIGSKNEAFQTILDQIQKNKKIELPPTTTINIQQLLPQERNYYHYLGSLTTAPYTENVEWYVLKQPVEISKNQLQTFQKYYLDNSREVQPLYNRVILEK